MALCLHVYLKIMETMKTLKHFAIIIFMAMSVSAIAQQNIKLAIISYDSILSAHPKYANNSAQIEASKKLMEDQLSAKSRTFQTKVKNYQDSFFQLSESVRKSAEMELNQLEQELMAAREKYQEDSEKLDRKFMEPIYKDVEAVTNKVSKQLGYNFVAGKEMFFISDTNNDITEAVIAEIMKL